MNDFEELNEELELADSEEVENQEEVHVFLSEVTQHDFLGVAL